ncbi:hypothetical protein BSPWISOXPB_5415 [uncultured Gammaproteobacteria bacterium]|nr:hypothetical protein BSPWISOXPB_5415 [uncultured Gammaproteobacteria bacterium]
MRLYKKPLRLAYYEAYYNIGVAYAKLDKFKEAIKAFKKALRLSLIMRLIEYRTYLR